MATGIDRAESPASQAPSWSAVITAGGARLSAALLLVELVAGMQSLVVTAAMPRVLADLGDVSLYGLVFGAYMLTGLVSIPLAGREADRQGPLVPFLRSLAIFAVGTLLSTAAPSMPLLVGARAVQGYGGGAMYALGYGIVARAYPPAARPRMVALLTAVWVVSGLVAPSYGAALATTVGWRWAFASVLPMVAAVGVLAGPALRHVGAAPTGVSRLPLRWPLLLAGGGGAMLAGFGAAAWWSIPLGAAGLVMTVVGLRRVLPTGSFRALPGLPAAVAVSFLLNLAFFTADSFVPLLLTGTRGTSVGEAGIAVTLVALSWSAGTAWQARMVRRISLGVLSVMGSAVFALGTAGFAAALAGEPLWLAYTAWTIAGAGVGVAVPSILLVSMEEHEGEGVQTAVAARFVSARVGIILGTGAGGLSVAAAQSLHRPLATGLAGTFALAVAGAAAAAVVSRRLVSA